MPDDGSSASAGLDPGIWHLMTGLPYLVRVMGFGLRKPKVPVRGRDVARRVEAVGKNVTGFKPGDELFGVCEGSFAEYATARPDKLAHKPANLTSEQAAAVPISGLTALQALRDSGKGELILPSAAEVLALAGGLSDKYRLPFVILEQTAIRIGEVVSLERDDVDAPSLRFRIKAVNRKGRRGSRRPRFVPVPGWLMEIIATSLPLRGRVFPDVTANGLRSAMRDLCESAGLPHCTPHRLRHRRISLWHFQGVPAHELADHAGHSKPSMSLDVYSHVIVPDEVDPEALKALLSGGIAAPTAAAVMHW